jgi:hypothetical protein
LGVRFHLLFPLLMLAFVFPALPPAFAQAPPPELIAIPAGEFLMGSQEGASWEKPAHPVEISAFSIAKRPVTNAQFRAFRPEHHSPVDDADSAAVRGVSWEDAAAYCQWLSAQTGAAYRLPSEAEWERAVRGGLEQKKYPWGDEPAVPDDKVADRAAWPPAPANPFGLLIEHELWEWTADIYDRSYYQQSPQKDPKGPPEGEFRVLRGGSYPNDPNSMRCSNRGSARPKTVLPNVTFRVAREGGSAEITESRRPAASAPAVAVREAAAASMASARPAQAPAARVASAVPVAASLVPQATTSAALETTPGPAPAAPRPSVGTSAPIAGAAGLTRVDVTVSSAQVIVTLSLSGPAEYTTTMLTSPDRVVIDLPNAAVALARQYGSVDVGNLGIQRVRWAPFEAAVKAARIVIDLAQPVSYTIETAASGLVVRLKPR